MTNVSNPSEKTNMEKASVRFAAHQVLTEHYPSLSQLFLKEWLTEKLEAYTAEIGTDWLKTYVFRVQNEISIDRYPKIVASASKGMMTKLNDILECPMDYYEALKELMCAAELQDFPPEHVKSISYMAEGLRSLLLEAHMNQQGT
ncbi:MAG: hypothetical protein KDD15_15840 [Lewinella sp.]|nr:hypothetical protein [Lewinella sp.]